MKVTGISFIRNAIQYDYPIVEAITSILPLCDEVIVAVGNSEDDTLALIQDIPTDKIRIIKTVWDDDLREGGQVLAVETNKVLDEVSADTDWVVYIQGDEAIHEQYIPNVQAAMQQYVAIEEVEGLVFDYLHFWGSYDYVADARKWYRKEVRVIKNDKTIRSYKDAQGFRKNGKQLWVKAANAYIYHYGWVRPPKKLQQKRRDFHKLWHSDEWIEHHIEPNELFDYNNIDSVRRFEGTHPQVLKERIRRLNWNFQPPIPKLSLKEQLSRWIETTTGHRIGEFRNYRMK